MARDRPKLSKRPLEQLKIAPDDIYWHKRLKEFENQVASIPRRKTVRVQKPSLAQQKKKKKASEEELGVMIWMFPGYLKVPNVEGSNASLRKISSLNTHCCLALS
ncbi:hypothetical protein PoB_005785900 [Plakobranchus ocellatus]|uniref:Uncharacterized protein n=1 Tax=Plakobranchus ocellatus TaxID=259542 RepID=A0AAV4CFC7_9GAST|nr:hypothetical protein PoB_005785900 [Plakobranchus ocellatus]